MEVIYSKLKITHSFCVDPNQYRTTGYLQDTLCPTLQYDPNHPIEIFSGHGGSGGQAQASTEQVFRYLTPYTFMPFEYRL